MVRKEEAGSRRRRWVPGARTFAESRWKKKEGHEEYRVVIVGYKNTGQKRVIRRSGVRKAIGCFSQRETGMVSE